jgi:zinc protease
MDSLSDVLRNPAFPTDEVERLRGEILNGLRIRQQDTRYRSSRAFRENLYPENHPYHHTSQGTLETIPTISIADMQNFHSQYYGPQGMVMVIVGAVQAGQVVEVVREHLGEWRKSDQPQPPPMPDVLPVDEIRRASISIAGKTQSDIVLGVPGPSRYAEDYRAATLANSVLGQFGMMGRIGTQVREKLGLAYHASSRVEGGHGPAPWVVSAGVNPANVQLAVDRIQDEIRRITTEPVSADELADNQAYFTGHLPLQLESSDGIAGTILSMETYDLGLDYLLKYREAIYALTPDALLEAAQHYWNADAYVLAVAGPDGA